MAGRSDPNSGVAKRAISGKMCRRHRRSDRTWRGHALWLGDLAGRLLLPQLWCSGLAANQQCARLSKKLLVLKSTNNIELNENKDIVSDIIDVTFSLCRSGRSRTIQAKQPTNPRAVIDPPVSLTGAM